MKTGAAPSQRSVVEAFRGSDHCLHASYITGGLNRLTCDAAARSRFFGSGLDCKRLRVKGVLIGWRRALEG